MEVLSVLAMMDFLEMGKLVSVIIFAPERVFFVGIIQRLVLYI